MIKEALGDIACPATRPATALRASAQRIQRAAEAILDADVAEAAA